MLVGIGIAVSVLYSGVSNSRNKEVEKVMDESRFRLLPAVPSDAVMLCCFSDAQKASEGIYGESKFPAALKATGLKLGRMTVSLHYSGRLSSLYVLDLGKAASSDLMIRLCWYKNCLYSCWFSIGYCL